MRPDLTTHYLGLTLTNPVVASSGPMTGDLDALARWPKRESPRPCCRRCSKNRSLDLPRARKFNTITRVCRYTSTLSSAPDVHRYNVGPRDYLKLIETAKQTLSIPIIGSLNGYSRGGWVRYAREIQDAGADALELNVYIVPTSPTMTAQEIEEQHLDLVRAIRGATSIPLAVKIGAQFSSLPNFVGPVGKGRSGRRRAL